MRAFREKVGLANPDESEDEIDNNNYLVVQNKGDLSQEVECLQEIETLIERCFSIMMKILNQTKTVVEKAIKAKEKESSKFLKLPDWQV
mmetsp:Transcript_41030/g.62415  ORF Transcript_41030/g.62415 Transcript_41030/m.62415 type:complete len:89 (-) Transcript_41030:2-268(-)